MSNELTIYEAQSGGEVQISIPIIKKYLCPNATEQEALMFLQLCHYQGLNPFLREAYLVKYSGNANIIVGKETFTKRAENHPQYDGFKAGVIVQNDEELLHYREGSLVLGPEVESLRGGWAEVYRKDQKVPIRAEVSIAEYDQKQSLWKTKPATMIRKVALVQALREAFPNLFGGMYDSAEMPVDINKLPDIPVDIPQTTKPSQIAPGDAREPKHDDLPDGGKLPGEEQETNPEHYQKVLDKLTQAKSIPHVGNIVKAYVNADGVPLSEEDQQKLRAIADSRKTEIAKELKAKTEPQQELAINQ